MVVLSRSEMDSLSLRIGGHIVVASA